jgi:hypothetical protein
MKVKIQALFFVLLYRTVFADVDYLSRCPEYNPQNELDIELVSTDSLKLLHTSSELWVE